MGKGNGEEKRGKRGHEGRQEGEEVGKGRGDKSRPHGHL